MSNLKTNNSDHSGYIGNDKMYSDKNITKPVEITTNRK